MAHGMMLWSACLALIGSFAVRKIPLVQSGKAAEMSPPVSAVPNP
jgi:hypothetical protein